MERPEIDRSELPLASAAEDEEQLTAAWLPLVVRVWWRFPRLVKAVVDREERQLLEHRGRVVGALIPATDLRRLRELDDHPPQDEHP